MSQPFFTIGVTTYNRPDLLRQALSSVLAQSFGDFEVIVGNDYTKESLTGDILGIDDSRVRFVNHPSNLKELGNMNALLGMGRGRYFTWLCDDDLYTSNFLESMHDSLIRFDYPPCAFSSYDMLYGDASPKHEESYRGNEKLFTGRQFLREYFNGKLKLIGTFGIFETGTLRTLGGMEELCDSGVGLYGEYYLLARCGLIEKILYVNAPLVKYRAHEGSWSGTNLEIDLYRRTGNELLRRCAGIFSHPSLREDLGENLLAVCRLHLRSFYSKVALDAAAATRGAGSLLDALGCADAEAAAIRRSFYQLAGDAVGVTFGIRLAGLRYRHRAILVLLIIYRKLKSIFRVRGER